MFRGAYGTLLGERWNEEPLVQKRKRERERRKKALTVGKERIALVTRWGWKDFFPSNLPFKSSSLHLLLLIMFPLLLILQTIAIWLKSQSVSVLLPNCNVFDWKGWLCNLHCAKEESEKGEKRKRRERNKWNGKKWMQMKKRQWRDWPQEWKDGKWNDHWVCLLRFRFVRKQWVRGIVIAVGFLCSSLPEGENSKHRERERERETVLSHSRWRRMRDEDATKSKSVRIPGSSSRMSFLECVLPFKKDLSLLRTFLLSLSSNFLKG